MPKNIETSGGKEYMPFPLPICPPKSKTSNAQKVTCKFSRDLKNDFFNFSIDKAQKLLETKPEKYWEEQGEQRALKLFHSVAERVPAYKDFLKKNKIKPEKIKTIEDFKQVPWIDKENYLRKYPLDKISWDGLFFSNQMISVSSGSSGEPFYWPRGSFLEMETSYVQEMYLKTVFQADRINTLYVNAFAMGMYIAGPIILNSALRVAQKGYPITVITPGLDVDNTCKAIQGVIDQHEQIVLAGYAPFIKDILDKGIEQGIDWHKLRIRFLLAGEGFNESWRELIADKIGQKEFEVDFINIYGTADASIVGHETPLSVTIRRIIDKDQELRNQLFNYGENRLPTLVQYYPSFKYFEKSKNNDEILFTATAGVPLVRYNIHDRGGILTKKEIVKAIKKSKSKESLKNIMNSKKAWNLPFVYVYGKSDHTVTLYGLNIYPENIKAALEDALIRSEVSGRFTMETQNEKNSQDQYLLINVELSNKATQSTELKKKIQDTLIRVLRQVNDEYGRLYLSIKAENAKPIVKLYKFGDNKYFSSGIKHVWTNKNG